MGKLSLGPKNILAGFGELHPRVLDAMDVSGPAVAFAIHIANIPFSKVKGATRPTLTLNDLQPVQRDFAFVVDEKVEAQALVNAAASANKTLITHVRVFDEFSGQNAQTQMGMGKKSIAITVRLQPAQGTLTDEEIEAVSTRVIAAVKKATGGELRA